MFALPRAISRSGDVLVYCHDRALETVASYKYLGVFLDSELSWRHHIDHVLRKVSGKIFAIHTAGWQLTLKSRRQYYVFVIQPDLEYGSTASRQACALVKKNAFSRQVGKESAPSLEPDSNNAASEDFWTCTTVSAF